MSEEVWNIRPERIEKPLYTVGDRVLIIDRFTLDRNAFFWTGTVREVHREIWDEHKRRGRIFIYYEVDYDKDQHPGRTPPQFVYQRNVGVASIRRLCDVVKS